MSKHMPGVPYLEASDFNGLKLKPHVGNGKPVVVMAQGIFCGYCTQAKPAFMEFCKETAVIGATIQIDTDTDVAKKIGQWDNSYRGVPTYLGFDSQGNYAGTHKGGRDKASILAFAASLK